jgi:hypothetical protein
MEVNLHNYRPGDDSRQRLALTHLTNDQARTVYFALREYEDKLLVGIKNATSEAGPPFSVTQHEDLMFLSEALHQVEDVLFELLENHSSEVKGAIRSWLDI